MPSSLTYPGVYIEEIPSGVRTITGVATSITAFVGRALRGPTDDPVIINSFSDFERTFGGLHVDYPMSYAVRDFYLNGGSQAIIVRLYKFPDTEEESPDTNNESPGTNGEGRGKAKLTIGNLQLVAANPGEWGNKLKAEADNEGIDETVAERYSSYGLTEADLFNLTVMENNGRVEVFRNVSVKKDAGPRRVDRVLKQESELVRLFGSLAEDASNPLDSGTGSGETPPDETPPGDETPPSDTPTVKRIVSEAAEGGTNSAALDSNAYLGIEENGSEEGSEESDQTKKGFYALNKADLFNLLCIPPDSRDGDTAADVYQAAMTFCREQRAMLIVDPPANWGKNPLFPSKAREELSKLGLSGLDARNAAIYFPRVLKTDPMRDGQIDTFVPCGIVAGVMARTDVQRGVWKAPAGLDAALNGIQGLEVNLNDQENGLLNPLGINCLRSFPVNGRVVWGARTLRGADQLADEYKYIPVRRLALFIEESLYRGTQWVVFEPNDEPLWGQIRLNIGAFMQNLFRQGAFQGKSPREAYFVKCDKETTTQNDINLGIVNIIVGFAPLKPAEFVVIKLQQMAGQIEV